MTSNIPRAFGVPGRESPPEWLGATANVSLDDPRWNGATQRTFGGGTSQNAVLKAIQLTTPAAGGGVNGAIYLSFRAAYVQAVSALNDFVYFGIQAGSGGKAMIARVQVHGASFTAGNALPIPNVAFWTSTDGTTWTLASPGPGDPQPTWITGQGRSWLHPAEVSDPANRWAVQLKIPVTAAVADIIAPGGPNLGSTFRMWYLIRGSVEVSPGSFAPTILGEFRTSGTSTIGSLNGSFLPTSVFEQYQLTSGPAASGGIALQWDDVLVSNGLGEGWMIQNGASNTFIARPRNYRPLRVLPTDPDFTIPAQGIEATFRIANFGAVLGQDWNPILSSGTWDLVPGVQPVPSQDPIPPLGTGLNPPATNPIRHTTMMTLDSGKSTHQCILCTLTGTNLNFLNDSVYSNMNFDHASTLVREAEIRLEGLSPSPEPCDVYLAVEQRNLRASTPGRNEGKFLDATFTDLIELGGPLAEKLRKARSILSDGDGGSRDALNDLMAGLRASLQQMKYNDPAEGSQRIERLIETLTRWLGQLKEPDGRPDPAAIERLAKLFDALAEWLRAEGINKIVKLTAFVGVLNTWLQALPNDPAANEASEAMDALLAWLSSTVDGDRLTGPIAVLQRWFESGRPGDQLPQVAKALGDFLSAISSGANRSLTTVAANFAEAAAAWLRGRERLGTLVDTLSDVGLTDNELDQVFPTLRFHPYYDTGERVTDENGKQQPVLATLSTFGIYAYHEGPLEGWQLNIDGAQRIAQDLYLLSVPKNGASQITVKVQAVEPGEERAKDDPIVPRGGVIDHTEGCLAKLLRMLGLKK